MNESLINGDNLDPYEILNVSQNASVDEIRRARNKLAREFHPDKGFANQNIMVIINKAFDTLTDPEKKRNFYEKAESYKETDNQDFKHGSIKPNLLCLKGYEFRSKKYIQLIDTYRKEYRSKHLKIKPFSASFEDLVHETNKYVNHCKHYYESNIVDIFKEISDQLVLPEQDDAFKMFNPTDFKSIILSNRINKSKRRTLTQDETCIVDLNDFDLVSSYDR